MLIGGVILNVNADKDCRSKGFWTGEVNQGYFFLVRAARIKGCGHETKRKNKVFYERKKRRDTREYTLLFEQ